MKKNIILSALLFIVTAQSYAVTSYDVLADGQDYTETLIRVRKGSVRATLQNLEHYQALYAKPQTEAIQKEINIIIQDIKACVPGLINVGFFDLFPMHEWTDVAPTDKLYDAKQLMAQILHDHEIASR